MTEDHDATVRRSFERQVPLFSGPDSPFAGRLPGLFTWIEPLQPDMVVLDVACGAAHGAQQVADRVRQVVGVDLTPALLELGAARLDADGVRNVLLQEGHAEHLPFVDHSFDVVFCRSSLHHFADVPAAAREMARVCRRGGRVVVLDLVAPELGRDRFDHVHRLLDPSHVRCLLERELAELLAGMGTLTYAETTTLRFPVDVAVTDQSDRAEVLRLLQLDHAGEGPPTGFEPVWEEGRFAVSFTTCVVHATPGL